MKIGCAEMNGKAPLTALLSKVRSEPVDDPINLKVGLSGNGVSAVRGDSVASTGLMLSRTSDKTPLYAGTPLEPEALTMGQFSGLGNQQATVSWQWLAGFVDGEGCFCFYLNPRKTRPHPNAVPSVIIVNSHHETIRMIGRFLQEHGVGFHISDRKSPKYGTHWKPVLVLEVWGIKRVSKLLPQILPYLITKCVQAEAMQKFIDARLSSPITEPYRGDEWKYVQTVRTANQRGPQRPYAVPTPA
jgi:hypothetical protein